MLTVFIQEFLGKSKDNYGDKNRHRSNSKSLAPTGTANIKHRPTTITDYVWIARTRKNRRHAKS